MTVLRWILTRPAVQRRLRPFLFRLIDHDSVYAIPSWDEPCFFTRRLFSVFGWTLDLHQFVSPDDPNNYHSHPYRALRLVLSGGYTEQVMPQTSPIIARKNEHGDRVLSFTEDPYLRTLHEGQGGWVNPEKVHRVDFLWKPAGRPPQDPHESSLEPVFSLWWHGERTHETWGYRHEGSQPWP